MKSIFLRSQSQAQAAATISAGIFFTLLSAVANAQTGEGQDTVGAPPVTAGTGPKRVLVIVPRVSVAETLTDNVRLSTTARQSELVSEIAPGIRIVADGARIKGYFDYALNGRLYLQNSSGTNIQNALTTFGTVEAIEKWAFLDFSGSISQQAISALGARSTNSASINSNQTESASYRLSPYLRGRVGNVADYEARYSIATNRSQTALASDVTTKDAMVKLNGRGASARLGWTLDAARQNIVYGNARPNESDKLAVGLTYALTPNLNVSGTAGVEANNYTTFDKQNFATSGLGFNWVLSAATKFAASFENRSFGRSHNLSFEHRTPRTVWRFSDAQDVTATPSDPAGASLGSTYDLFFSQFANLEPDLIKRAALVSNFLQVNGINPVGNVNGSFLTSALSLQRRQDMAFSLLGVRDTVTFILSRTATSRVDTVTGAVDDLSNSNLIRQNGLSVNYSHRLTPDTALSALASTQQSSDSLGLQDNTTNSVNLSVSTRVGPKSTAILGVRRVNFDSKTSPYTESAITGTLNVQF